MQNLVGVGVADAAEEAGIGERALQRMVLGFQRRGEGFGGGFEGFESRGFGRRVQHVDLGAVLCAGLGQRERAAIELEGRERRAPPFQCSRPAIIRWIASHRPWSKPTAMRLPARRTSVTVCP